MGSSDVSKEKARRSRDRLSNLPDPLLHQIFSCLDTKQAIQSCVLSKRWRDFWVSLPHLNFDYRSFHTKSDFQNFVCKVLYSRLDNPIFGGKFGFRCGHCWKMDETLIKKVISCVESHWFQHLHMEVNTSLPDALLNSKSIETLDLKWFKTLPQSLASFTMLNSLHLKNCCLLEFLGCNYLAFHSRVAIGVDIGAFHLGVDIGAVIAGDFWELKIEILAPNLTSFRHDWMKPMDFGEINLPSVNFVDISVDRVCYRQYEEENDNMNLINMFRGLHKAQYVKLHYHTIEVLTLVPGLLEKQPSPFTNLKSLKLYLPYNTKSSKVPSHVMRYLLGDSSGADLIIVKS
ncbi:hypothetical protein GH714_034450 [Hevea brasiliensis]|uniref:F-box domain-containing protein n=1 Tax=Hevea brasiliensis TaxID=3981 RepID=A0A6A6N6R5_HEVBR|nr:hypothetical protein GH714_034450 [Hevea brasiliensis]